MRRFRYLIDPLCLVAITMYAANRWWLKPHLDAGFMRSHFNDLWLIPAALPLVLWLQRKLGWRRHDDVPQPSEIALHLIVWAVVCELIGPRFVAHATADWRDVAAYVVGGVIAAAWWHRHSLFPLARRLVYQPRQSGRDDFCVVRADQGARPVPAVVEGARAE